MAIAPIALAVMAASTAAASAYSVYAGEKTRSEARDTMNQQQFANQQAMDEKKKADTDAQAREAAVTARTQGRARQRMTSAQPYTQNNTILTSPLGLPGYVDMGTQNKTLLGM